MHLLDIGGGFPGTRMNIEIIAEPGRYYVASAFTLTTMVFAKRMEIVNEEPVMMYYINDGRHGSFTDLSFGENQVVPIPLIHGNNSRKMYHSVIWGPTCNSLDCIRTKVMLPEMNIGEWMTFEDMGAYTMALCTKFNGFQMPILKYHASEKAIAFLRNLPVWSRFDKCLNLDNSLFVNSIINNLSWKHTETYRKIS
ncbi:Ornithine decarboxylase-like protein [Leptotrombidium deliense]|uniref:Ornithine decarboxylase-like protein n=1 Tax=Leptotrombidium deliense TaxID=299467 RepID=A0A443RXM2_9ACAR|nr:Ornithine decarboxylase-like protein [Leptotrombidium deliense]